MAALSTETMDAHLRLASRDPLRFLTLCRDHYKRTIRDYRCHFTKQESIRGRLGPVEEIAVMFRQEPFSVDFRWIKNPGRAKRASYVAGRWVVDGRDLALFVPSGILGLLVPKGVKRDVRGPDARNESRSLLTGFGYLGTLDDAIKYCHLAEGMEGYELHFLGQKLLNGRPCYVLERRLPRSGEGILFPDRVLVLHIDRQWLVPTAFYAYDDEAKTQLLGSYQLTDPRFNVGLTDADFAE